MLAKSCFHRVVLGGTPNQPQTGAAKQRIVCKADVSEACGSGRMGRTAALCESRLCKHACKADVSEACSSGRMGRTAALCENRRV